MDGVITGETDELTGLSIIDNDGVEHVIDLQKSDGQITAHNQDGYPDDPHEREYWEDENVSQARRYAKFHVYRERGYETLPRYQNPDRLTGVLLALAGLTNQEFESYFDELYRRVDADDYRDLAPSVESDDFRMYRQDVSLAEDLEEVTEAFTRWARDIDDRVAAENDTPQLPLAEAVSAAFEDGVDPVVNHARSDVVDHTAIATIGSVSEVYLRYFSGFNEPANSRGDFRDDGEATPDADAVIQFLPLTFDSLTQFRSFSMVHLRAQVRDCYLGMGVEPPEVFRVLGPGMWLFIKKYRMLDVYEEYHDVAADIDGYHYPMAGDS